MDILIGVCLGIGLSAACGFRVFVPPLFLSFAALSGHVTLAHGFQWIGSYPALAAFGVATALEIAGYYVPWIDHLLDAVATPAAVVAGIVVTASVITGMSPLMKWTLAAIAGGGVAALVQSATVLGRTASTATTGGFGNPLFATVELTGAVLTSVLTILAPLVVGVLVLAACWYCARKLLRSRNAARHRVAV